MNSFDEFIFFRLIDELESSFIDVHFKGFLFSQISLVLIGDVFLFCCLLALGTMQKANDFFSQDFSLKLYPLIFLHLLTTLFSEKYIITIICSHNIYKFLLFFSNYLLHIYASKARYM